MTAILALLLSVSCAFGSEKEPVKADLITSPPVSWLKTYSLSPYKELWSINVEVKNLEKDAPRLAKSFEKAGASLTQPLAFFPSSRTDRSRQLSFRSSLKGAQAVLKILRKTAVVKDLRQRPAAEPISLKEISGKIEKLESDRRSRAAELASMPAVSALVEELLAHLSSARSVHERKDSEVLINIALKEKGQ